MSAKTSPPRLPPPAHDSEWAEALSRALLEASPDCVKLLDLEGRLLHMNGPGLCLMEVDDPAALRGRAWAALWPEPARAEVRAAVEAARRGEARRFQAPCPTAKGTPKWWDVSVTPVCAPGGRVLRLLAVSRDLTATRQTEAERAALTARLAEERRLSAAVLENVPAVAFLKDGEGRYTYVNGAFERLFGLRRGDALGKTDLELFGPQMAVPLRQNDLRVIASGGSLEFEERADVGGRPMVYSSVKFVLPAAEGQGAGVGGISVDITDRKQAEEALRESERRFRETLEGVRAVGVTLDRAGRITFANRFLLELTGYAEADVLGRGWFELFIPQGLEVERAFRESIARGEIFPHYENEILTRRGERRLISWDNTVLRDAEGRVSGTASIGRDITDERAAQAALAESEARARRLAESQKRFVNDAAHELRAPLTAIQGNLEIMARFKRMTKADRGQALAEVGAEAARLGRLVNDMLALARGDAGAGLRLAPLRLDRVLAEALEAARGLAGRHTLTADELPPLEVRGDPDRLKQLALQLLENALKYTPEGGRVRLSLRAEAGWAELRVCDTGIGIAPEELPRVFERFYRSDQARGRAAGGTGLGLPIAKWIVEAHGGRIWLESEPGRGTVAAVRLPLAGGDAPPLVDAHPAG